MGEPTAPVTNARQVIDWPGWVGRSARHVDCVRAIADDHPNIRVQVSGGIATAENRAFYADAGAARVVLGSAALHDRESLADMMAGAEDPVLLGLEVEEGMIRPRGTEAVE